MIPAYGLAERTSKNQLTLPKTVLEQAGLVELEISDADLADAVNWARKEETIAGVGLSQIQAGFGGSGAPAGRPTAVV
ncbi:hypothetical protein KBY58_11435 [Cyanobium sp. HWJ4-Hawea]|uniref:hypothetical protein n=1 Tax=Cyanobium sp. HWJ4-Hawea TaxID=2823713 RepID=UPI0020CDEAB2|nr:hypothetical protein [Cyanobium sp. HWJ4-Hawea]MCP9810047.1 hypothetical protein [Cyanobium sp. HWJ4-Hawea]